MSEQDQARKTEARVQELAPDDLEQIVAAGSTRIASVTDLVLDPFDTRRLM